MPRYVTMHRKPRAQDMWAEDSLVPSLTVDDHEPIDTGILSDTGAPIYRLPTPMGFGRDTDW